MTERTPVSTLAELDTLDERDVIAGYWAGYRGDGHEPDLEFNRSYWHGWRNGMHDSGRLQGDWAMASLAHEYVRKP
jgi:ribosome modulation factor